MAIVGSEMQRTIRSDCVEGDDRKRCGEAVIQVFGYGGGRWDELAAEGTMLDIKPARTSVKYILRRSLQIRGVGYARVWTNHSSNVGAKWLGVFHGCTRAPYIASDSGPNGLVS